MVSSATPPVQPSRLDLPLDLVHVLPGHVPAGITRAIGDDGLRSYGEDILEHARAIACESVKASAVRIDHLRLGNRNEELIVASQRAHRLVMGRRHSHSLDWIAAGIHGCERRELGRMCRRR